MLFALKIISPHDIFSYFYNKQVNLPWVYMLATKDSKIKILSYIIPYPFTMQINMNLAIPGLYFVYKMATHLALVKSSKAPILHTWLYCYFIQNSREHPCSNISIKKLIYIKVAKLSSLSISK